MRKAENSSIDFQSIGATVKRYRSFSGITQAQLAKRTHVSPRHIGGLETGDGCSIDLLFELVQILGIPGDEIFRPTVPLDPLKAKRAMVTNLLLRCTEPQLNIALAVILSTLENYVPGDISAVAAASLESSASSGKSTV